MLKKSIIFICLLLFPFNAYAGNCLNLIKEIDNLLLETKQLSKDQLIRNKTIKSPR